MDVKDEEKTKWMYHPDGRSKIIKLSERDQCINDGWCDTHAVWTDPSLSKPKKRTRKAKPNKVEETNGVDS